MTVRLALSSAGLRISNPGVSALLATDNGTNFIFDSNFRAYFGIFMSGAVALAGGGGWTGGAGEGGQSAYQDVFFGKTFSSRPPVMCAWSSGQIGGAVQMFAEGVGNLGFYAWFEVQTDRLRLWYDQVAVPGQPVPGGFGDVFFIVGQS